MIIKHRKCYDKAKIKEVIIEGVKLLRANINDPAKYADNVIAGAEKVKNRLDFIKQYESESTKALTKTDKYYCEKLKTSYAAKGYVSSSMDIDIIADMIANKFNNKNIKNTIEQFSPTAAEPGRDAKYQSFVINQAKEKVEQEQIKLKQYTVIPRIDHEPTAEQEYQYHRTQLQNAINLPISESIDTMIAGALLQQGFKQQEVAAALIQSPCIKEKTGYENIIVKTAAKMQLSKDNKLDNDLVMGKNINK